MIGSNDNIGTVILVVVLAEVLKLCPRLGSLVSTAAPDIEPDNSTNSSVVLQECDDCRWTIQWFGYVAFVYHFVLLCGGCCCWKNCCNEVVEEKRGLRLIKDD
jgi:hypothetical protein